MVGKILSCIFAAVAGGEFYRLGGTNAGTKWRDFGVPTIALLIAFAVGVHISWWWILAFAAMFGSMTTYCKFGNQEDVKWYNWWLTGALYGLAVFPICIGSGKWLGFVIRTAVLAFAVMAWSEKIDDVEWEERGRGWLYVGTIPLLLL